MRVRRAARDEIVGGGAEDHRSRSAASAAADSPCATASHVPGVPQYAVRTQRPRLVRVPSTCSVGPWGKTPCAWYMHNAGGWVRMACVPTEAPGRTCQLSAVRKDARRHAALAHQCARAPRHRHRKTEDALSALAARARAAQGARAVLAPQPRARAAEHRAAEAEAAARLARRRQQPRLRPHQPSQRRAPRPATVAARRARPPLAPRAAPRAPRPRSPRCLAAGSG